MVLARFRASKGSLPVTALFFLNVQMCQCQELVHHWT